MKALFVILTLSGILMQSMSKVIILINFQRNRDYIAQNLCVQKEVKGNCCKGSCQLNKELKKEEKKESPANSSAKDKGQTNLFCQSFIALHLQNTISKPIHSTLYREPKSTAVSFSVFHPPTC